MKDGIDALSKQAPWVTFKTILQYLVQGVHNPKTKKPSRFAYSKTAFPWMRVSGF